MLCTFALVGSGRLTYISSGNISSTRCHPPHPMPFTVADACPHVVMGIGGSLLKLVKLDKSGHLCAVLEAHAQLCNVVDVVFLSNFGGISVDASCGLFKGFPNNVSPGTCSVGA